MRGDKRFIQSNKLKNSLSFGPGAGEIELKSVNVLTQMGTYPNLGEER